MNKLTRIMTLTTLATLIAAPAFADRQGRKKRDGPKMFDPAMLERAAERIGLDDNTLKIIKEKAFTAQRASIGMEAELKTARLDLRHMLDSDAPDRSGVLRQIDKVGRLEIKLRKHRVGLMLDIRGHLTPDQIGKLKKARHEFRKVRRERRRQRRGQPSAPPTPPPR